MAMLPSSSVSLLTIAVLISMLHVSLTARNIYGDGRVYLYKNGALQKQLNIYTGDQFVLKVRLRSGQVDEYNDISHLNVTQNIKYISSAGNVTVVLSRVENFLFNVTSVWPVNVACGGNVTTLSQSVAWPSTYVTDLTIRNSRNGTLTASNVQQITLLSHRIATNPGIRVDIYPNP